MRIDESEQTLELSDRETEITATQDETKPRLVIARIEPVPAGRALGRLQQIDLFIIANGLKVAA